MNSLQFCLQSCKPDESLFNLSSSVSQKHLKSLKIAVSQKKVVIKQPTSIVLSEPTIKEAYLVLNLHKMIQIVCASATLLSLKTSQLNLCSYMCMLVRNRTGFSS